MCSRDAIVYGARVLWYIQPKQRRVCSAYFSLSYIYECVCKGKRLTDYGIIYNYITTMGCCFVFSAIRSVSTGNMGTTAGIRRSIVIRNC